ncbi:cytochrome c peroxidase [Marinobacter sp. SBS5]|uniref:cytochrome c peroxidase n=1 Tax=Marinobacter sp. SBS5 TaxID=3401754 RepID=UPI003AABAEDD
MTTTHALTHAIRSFGQHRHATWWSAALMTAMLGAGGGLAIAGCGPCSPCKGKCKAGQYCKAGCNPCAAKNPCASKNPCAMKHPCAMKDAMKDPCAGKNPCATKNPCSVNKTCAPKGCNPCAATGKCGAKANPCAAKKVTRPAGYQAYMGNPDTLVAMGKKLFNDPSLSSNGLACASCHNDGAGYNATFTNDYPHPVAMAKNIFGMDQVHLDEMVQICMVQPMASEPFPWDSQELAALTAYMSKVQANQAQ